MKNNLNIIIIEDELLIAEMLKDMLIDLGYTVAAIAKNYESAIANFTNNNAINFAILDINLRDEKTGLDIAQYINDNINIPFIFLTSYSYMPTFREAKLLNPEAYLIKPFTKTDLFINLEIVAARKPQSNVTGIIETQKLNTLVNHSDIFWLKESKENVEIKTANKTYLVSNTLDNILSELNDEAFLRVHPHHAVNINHAETVNEQNVFVEGEKIPLSKKFKDDFKKRIH